MINKYSLHKICNSNNISFSAIEYSKFKFGDGNIAKRYGEDLASNFINDKLLNSYNGEQIVVVSSPYSFIPTATYYLKIYFVYELNKWLAQNYHAVTEETKLYRSTSYSEDYGLLDAQDRLNLISKDIFYIDKYFIKVKIVIILDDIKITGSHEKMIIQTISSLNINSQYYLLYFAELVNKFIHPSFENELNHAFVNSLSNLSEIISGPNFSINTRIVKFILKSNHEDFKKLMNSKGDDFNKLIFNMAIGNSYHKIEEYRYNYLYLHEKLDKIKKPIYYGN